MSAAFRPPNQRAQALGMALLLLGLGGLAAPQDVRAEPVASIKLPETIPSLESKAAQSLLDPPPLNGAWAEPGHRPLGVQLDNYSLTQEQIEAAASTGCKLVRLPIPMEHFLEDAEPDWAVLDQVVSRLNRAGFEILPLLTAKVAVPEFYVSFCSAVAERYGRTFEYYQLLDNINYKIGLETQDYADLISLARAAIILADRDARIVCGGIRGSDLTYLDMLESQGAMRGIDVIALNLYPPKGAVENPGRGSMAEHSLPYVDYVLGWAQQRGKRVWVTSFGVSTSLNWVGVDQAAQAAAYARGALYLGWLGVECIIFAAIQDSDPSGQRPAETCGLLDVSGAPKASYYVLRSLNQAIAGAYHIQPPFMYQGFTFQKPEAQDLWVAAELQDVPGSDALEQFQVHGLQVYSFWFYSPESEEYTLIYWLAEEPLYPTLLTLNLGSVGLTPEERFILLDNAPSAVTYYPAQNFIYLPYQPASTVPGVIKFEVNENGRAG